MADLRPMKQPRARYPAGISRQFERDLIKILKTTVERTSGLLVPQIPSLIAEGNSEILRLDGMNENLNAIIVGLLAGMNSDVNNDKSLIADVGFQVSQSNERDNERILKAALGTAVFLRLRGENTTVGSFVNGTAGAVKSVMTQHIQGINQIVLSGWRQGLTTREIEKRLREATNLTANRVKFIARNDISSLNGQLTRLRQESIGIKHYRWRTSQDEKVRPTHRAKEGKIFSWDDPPSDTGHPGEDYNCRCYGEAVIPSRILRVA